MGKTTNISPGMTINLNNKVFRVEAAVKVATPKGAPFIKTRLRDLITDNEVEKNFKIGQEVDEVSLVEHQIEYLYPEGENYLFIDINTLEQVLVSQKVLQDKINFLKEGVEVKAMLYGDTVFAIELPQFLEIMVVKIQSGGDKLPVGNSTKTAILESGAKIEVPLFIEVGDIIKVDTVENSFVQRV